MTLIACTIKSYCPVVVSDVLVSDEVSESIQMPTNIFDINNYLEQDRKPIRLAQKTYIIKDNLTISLAGEIAEIVPFLRELKLRCAYYDNITEADVVKFIEDYDMVSNFAHSAFLILLVSRSETENVVINQIHYPTGAWSSVEGELFDHVLACGTGKNDFIHWMKALTVKLTNEEYPFLQSIALNACYIARLLATERISLHTIKKHWGGGFEMTLFNGKTFTKVDEIAYVIFQAYFDDEGNISSLVPGLVLFYKYQLDNLFISAIEVSEFSCTIDEDMTTFVSKKGNANLYTILPMDRSEPFSTDELPEDFSFHTNRIGVGFAFITEKVISPASYFIEDKETSIVYTDNDSIKISLKTEMNNIILNQAKVIYPNLNQ